MTDKPIDELTDDELRVAIAVEVMGYKLVSEPDNMDTKSETWIWVHPKDGLLRGEPFKVYRKYDHSWSKYRPDEDIAAAWEVFKTCNGWMFSKRRRFLNALELELRRSIGINGWSAAWPDLILFLSPEVICLAALRVIRALPPAPEAAPGTGDGDVGND